MSRARDALLRIRTTGLCLPWRVLGGLGLYRPAGPPVAFVIEKADWAIRWVGEHVCEGIEREAPGTAAVTVRPERLVDRVVHFGSQYMWLAWGGAMARSNRYVVSFFHGKREDGAQVARHIDAFLESVPRLSRIVTACSLMERRLMDWGVPAEKVVRIPIGVDTRVFTPPSERERTEARAVLGIPPDRIVVGSFQKDGVGWGDGMEPKLIKGPDVFLAVVERLAREFPVFVLLTGPARGFVRRGLERLGIPHGHSYVGDHGELARCYRALDLYLITSREEGGPMALMESMASGVPVVSTAVGMSPDLIEDGVTGALASPDDVTALVEKSLALLRDPGAAAGLRARAREAVAACDWRVVAHDHLEKVYRPLS